MPRRPRPPCPIPGCPELTSGGQCAKHKREANKSRVSNGKSYDVRWQRTRRAYLYANPWCVLCAQPAVVADHHPITRRQLIDQGVSDPDAPERLRPLCVRCHNGETAKRQPGGWAAERRSERESGLS
ncbi:HNH endonuclease [Streptomyces sp. SID3343]|nr:HNH endonuclease [Streptomyces sp. SID3343]